MSDSFFHIITQTEDDFDNFTMANSPPFTKETDVAPSVDFNPPANY